jgi:hypothetical protein
MFLPEVFVIFALFFLISWSFTFQIASKSVNFNDLLIILLLPILFFVIILFYNQLGLQGVLLNENFVLNDLIV